MILTSAAITTAIGSGDIVINPFDPNCLGSVSYHFHAGSEIAVIDRELDSRTRAELEYIAVPREGILLSPERLYLLSTIEEMGSSTYAQRIFGTRATGNCGLFIDVSADLGHVGCVTRWTLELVPTQPLLLFPGQRLGQITFWTVAGDYSPYQGHYHRMQKPLASKSWMET